MTMNGGKRKIIASNKKAFHNYSILDRIEAGIALQGTEVKSLRNGKVSFQDAYVTIDKNYEAYLVALHISPYDHGNRFNHDPLRKRKLLLHKKEILKLRQAIQEKGLTLVPTSIYFSQGMVKIEVAKAKGKNKYDKRDVLKQKSIKSDLAGFTKSKIKGG